MDIRRACCGDDLFGVRGFLGPCLWSTCSAPSSAWGMHQLPGKGKGCCYCGAPRGLCVPVLILSSCEGAQWPGLQCSRKGRRAVVGGDGQGRSLGCFQRGRLEARGPFPDSLSFLLTFGVVLSWTQVASHGSVLQPFLTWLWLSREGVKVPGQG